MDILSVGEIVIDFLPGGPAYIYASRAGPLRMWLWQCPVSAAAPPSAAVQAMMISAGFYWILSGKTAFCRS